MCIQPTKEHYDIINNLGTKFLIGIISLNGGALIALIPLYFQNHSNVINNVLLLIIAILISGILCAMIAAKIILNIFLDFGINENKLEIESDARFHKEMRIRNKLIEITAFGALLAPIFSVVVILCYPYIIDPKTPVMIFTLAWLIMTLIAVNIKGSWRDVLKITSPSFIVILLMLFYKC